MKTLVARISAQPFFQGLSAQHIKILSEFAMPTEFGREEVIFREQDLANRFYLIEKGRVALESRTPDGRLVLVETVGPGEALGWSWLFPPYTWHFGARALEKVKAVFFYGTRLREFCDEDREFGYELIRRMAEVTVKRLESTRKQLLLTQAQDCRKE
jgi:CRP/FNR family transcriptional regulator, cyclic AMP receptor protein